MTRFWTEPVAAQPLAAFRISIALIALVDTATSVLPYASRWFGAQSPNAAAFGATYYLPNWPWSLLQIATDAGTARVLAACVIGFALLSLIGLLTRLSCVGLWTTLSLLHAMAPNTLNAGDLLLRVATFYLVLMPCGAAWSLDARLARRGTLVVAPWSLRLAQIQICFVYFFTAIEKLKGFGSLATPGDWLGGSAVRLTLANAMIARWPWFHNMPLWISAPASWLTLGWELLFPVLVLWRRTRYAALAIGVILHVGIFATMEVTHFSFTTLAWYWLFVPAVVLMDLAGKQTGSPDKRVYTVFYDGMCPVCKKAKRNLERLDWLGRLTYRDIHDRASADAALPTVSYADMLRQMYVKRPDGSYFGGFEAFRALAAVLPLCWPLMPFLWLPGAKFLGTRGYKFIARNRFKFAKCDDEACNLHLKLLAGKELDDTVIKQVIELHERYRKAKATS
ncbi:MAG: DUF393 domain-containing protein [Planctomycetes bacterium]|nr:DUF393 domain-containing protein [Planctomycetota bacterium]